MKRLLLIVDPQYDFIEEGSLPVKGARAKMEALGDFINEVGDSYSDIVITADWHPMRHCSFVENGGEWPMHCVDHTHGAAIFGKVLVAAFNKLPDNVQILHKGNKKDKDEYSIFGNEENGLKLREFLASENFDEIHICGIAGDVCVLNTANDLIELLWGDKLVVLLDFIASIDGGEKLKKFCEDNKIKVNEIITAKKE